MTVRSRRKVKPQKKHNQTSQTQQNTHTKQQPPQTNHAHIHSMFCFLVILCVFGVKRGICVCVCVLFLCLFVFGCAWFACFLMVEVFFFALASIKNSYFIHLYQSHFSIACSLTFLNQFFLNHFFESLLKKLCF